MTVLSQLTAQAISTASMGNWDDARELNEKILELEPANIGALNRIAYCYMQMGKIREAKTSYEKVLTIERFNPIAGKYLQLLKSRIKPQPLTSLSQGDFIEEPGKTRSVSLQKLADPAILQSIPTATACTLVLKNHRVNVIISSNSTYIGCLPDDIAFRLQKMISAGNQYSVAVQSTTKKTCIVFIKETAHSANSPFATSFPLTSIARSSHQEDVLLDESPLDIRETGDEVETSEVEENDPME